jgi:hypothetical protein
VKSFHKYEAQTTTNMKQNKKLNNNLFVRNDLKYSEKLKENYLNINIDSYIVDKSHTITIKSN